MKKTIVSILILLIMITCVCSYSYADEITDSMSGWNQGNSGTANDMKSMASKVLGVVQVVGYAVSLVTLSILGIKYMYAATAEKAKIKEQLVPYAIGAVLLFGASTIISIINGFSQNI